MMYTSSLLLINQVYPEMLSLNYTPLIILIFKFYQVIILIFKSTWALQYRCSQKVWVPKH